MGLSVHVRVQTAKSAVEVADAAQAVGREDEISVISVTRTGVQAPVLA
jgi:hypothetical protein